MENYLWLFPILTLAVLGGYLLYLALASKHLAWRTHSTLRGDWFDAVSTERGTEILAIQTVRNSVMTATMTASTSTLGLMGAVTLIAPSMNAVAGTSPAAMLMTPRVAMELTAMALLLVAVVASTMAIRYYNHDGFVCAMPVGSTVRARWADTGRDHLRFAGVLYSWGLRCMILVTPVLVAIVYSPAGPVAALLVTGLLLWLERISPPQASK